MKLCSFNTTRDRGKKKKKRVKLKYQKLYIKLKSRFEQITPPPHRNVAFEMNMYQSETR